MHYSYLIDSWIDILADISSECHTQIAGILEPVPHIQRMNKFK